MKKYLNVIAVVTAFLITIGCGKQPAPAQPDGASRAAEPPTSEVPKSEPPAAGLVANPTPSMPAQTVTSFYSDNGGGLAVINADGSVSVVDIAGVDANGKPVGYAKPAKFFLGAIHKIPNLTNAVSFSGNTPYVKVKDGSWWEMKMNWPAEPRLASGNSISEIGGGYYPMTWVRMSDGTVQLSQGAAFTWTRPGPKLDKVVKLCGQFGFSLSVNMLRADGTVWVDTNCINGWVTASGDASASEIQGLDHVKDLAVCTPYQNYTPSGVGLLEDGSVTFWGIPNIADAGQQLPSPNTPELKRLIQPSRVQKIAAGTGCAAAIDLAGHVWVWGASADYADSQKVYPRLRGKDLPECARADLDVENAVQIPGLENIVDVQIFGSEAYALSKEGSLWVWNDSAPPQKILEGVKVP